LHKWPDKEFDQNGLGYLSLEYLQFGLGVPQLYRRQTIKFTTSLFSWDFS
jgi:hypothetical protein